MLFSLLCGAATVVTATASTLVTRVSQDVPVDAASSILAPFVSFSIEFSSFPDFAGNKSQPNKFSNQLLENLGHIQGVKPYIRVGGNTQDFALYDANLETQINGTVIPSLSEDYPSIISIGPSYFEAYDTFPGVKFSHGFNLGKNTTEGLNTLLATVPLACKALSHGNFAHWELGNEPDLFNRQVRPKNWKEIDYVEEWLSKSRIIHRQLMRACPHLAHEYNYLAPSFAGTANGLDPVKTWQAGIDSDADIKLNSMHNYMGGADSPGVTLARTLMNHTAVVAKVQSHVAVMKSLEAKGLAKGVPYILGEMNSLYHQGKPGLSNSFGAALWGVDFNLYCASQNIRRTHMHQGTNYRYASWQPIETNKTSIGTKAPYYGNAFVAAMLSVGTNRSHADVQVVNLPMEQETESAYAAYVDGKLSRIGVVNMQQYNYTVDTGSTAVVRPSTSYQFHVPGISSNPIPVRRLMANGTDSITGITWDGWSYNYELDGGNPVRLSNVTIGETVQADTDGIIRVELPLSSAALLSFGN
ncbi:Beta-glucuronidase [Penicillium oxalicum]|uniref:Beta-glucuronidase n=1 Tax=Penicillium oxalicum TaxID=69781 RepID=UPI0020B81E02|nr:Beta-glucuronidase [Penicillium oxalicum]KAI2786311.1 Beta-glucuronidase [Penicillium oxalicum]